MPTKLQAWVLFSFFLLMMVAEAIAWVGPKIPSIAVFLLPIFIVTKVLAIIIFLYCRPNQIVKGVRNGDPI